MAALLDGLHVLGPRPDRPRAEGRPGRLRPAHLARAARAASTRRRAGSRRPATSASTCSARPTPTEPRDAPTRTAPSRSSQHSAVPTGRDGRSTPTMRFPELARRSSTASTRATRARATTSTSTRRRSPSALFGDHMPANMLLLGAAYQRGLLPVSARGDRAGDPAQRRRGREEPRRLRAGAARSSPRPDAVEAGHARRPSAPARELVRAPSASWSRSRSTATAASCAGCSRSACPTWSPTRTRPTRARYAERRAPRARGRAGAHAAGTPSWPRPSPASLYKLMAYKDEYEVARLHLDAGRAGASCSAEFGDGRQGRAATCTRRCCGRWA